MNDVNCEDKKYAAAFNNCYNRRASFGVGRGVRQAGNYESPNNRNYDVAVRGGGDGRINKAYNTDNNYQERYNDYPSYPKNNHQAGYNDFRKFGNNVNQPEGPRAYAGYADQEAPPQQQFRGRQGYPNNHQVNDYYGSQRGRGRGLGRGNVTYDGGVGGPNNNNNNNNNNNFNHANSYSVGRGGGGFGGRDDRGCSEVRANFHARNEHENNRFDDDDDNDINDNNGPDPTPDDNGNDRNFSRASSNEFRRDFEQPGNCREGIHQWENPNDENDNHQPEKPREIYIPPDRFDERTVFSCGTKAGINFSNYDDIEVTTSGENIPFPIDTFRQANFKTTLQENIEKSRYDNPTPVQKYAIPILLENRDLMACAQTGSGKTAAFMIPIIHLLLDKSRIAGSNESSVTEPRAVIIAPTRELTTQIYSQARKFAHRTILWCQQLYGGTSVEYQLRQLTSGCDILVATPGRLLDVVKRKKISFSAVEFLVLDEADKMLDMGFHEDVEKILRHESMVPMSQRQTLMFSATFPPRIQELARNYMNNYVFLSVGVVGGACTDIEQTLHQVSKRDKRGKLDELLHYESESNSLSGILVFVDMKKTADFIAAFLSENNFPTTSIHGDRLQREREEALEDFKSGRMLILVATAVAARGLDIENVSHVINYDMPKTIDEYVHRIGRTGRVGNRGKATSFYDEDIDSRLQYDLVKILSMAKQDVPKWLLNDCDSGKSLSPSVADSSDIRNMPSDHKIRYGSKEEQDDQEDKW